MFVRQKGMIYNFNCHKEGYMHTEKDFKWMMAVSNHHHI